MADETLTKTQRIDDTARRERERSPVQVQATKAVRFPGERVYKLISNATGDGKYNCELQMCSSGNWTKASDPLVVCKVSKETSGHAFPIGTLFLAVGRPDCDGIIPVIPMFYAYAR